MNDYKEFYYWLCHNYKFIQKEKLFKNDWELDYGGNFDTWEQAIDKFKNRVEPTT